MYLQRSPASVSLSTQLSASGGIWLFFFELCERAYALCKGVCEYALGVAPVGYIRLDNGEEDARLLDSPGLAGVAEAELQDEEEENELDESRPKSDSEDEAVRVGRLLLRQFHHNTYHLYKRLRKVHSSSAKPLTEPELRVLCKKDWSWGPIAQKPESRWWIALAHVWGVALVQDGVETFD